MSRHTTGEQQVVVIGSDPIGAEVARNLGRDVVFLGLDRDITRRVAVEVQDAEYLTNMNQFSPPEKVDAAVLATARDSANLLAAKRLELENNADILVRLNDPAYQETFADLGVETVCATTDLGETLAEKYTRIVD